MWEELSKTINDIPSWIVYCGFAGVGAIVILIIVLAALKSEDSPYPLMKKGSLTCSVCGVRIIRVSYFWGNDRMCPKCNNRMKNKVSKEAFKSKFGEQ